MNGGTVTANGGYKAAGIGGGYEWYGCTVTINGGTVTANGGDGGAGIGGAIAGPGSVTINGGTVTASGSEGISVEDITLDYKNPTDSITASSYCTDNLVIAEGKCFTVNGTEAVYGKLTYDQLKPLADKTLVPAYRVRIADDIMHGTVSASPAVFAIKDFGTAGRNVKLTVKPDPGYYVDTVSFYDGTDDYTITQVDGVYVFAMVDKDVTVRATFTDKLAYPVWVGGERVTRLNAGDVLGDGKVSYTPATDDTPAALTLNGANITGGSNDYAAIHANGDLTINVTEDSTVTGPEADTSYGVYIGGSLTVNGAGTLTAAGGTSGEYGESTGVYAYKGAVIVNGKLIAAGGTSGEYGESFGVQAYQGAVIVNGALSATGGSAMGWGGNSYGVYSGGSLTVNGTGTLSAEGGTARRASYGVYGNAVTINGGTVTAKGPVGIHADNITLGYENPTDSIRASSYESDLVIAEGKCFTVNGTAAYYGTLTDAQLKTIADETLIPAYRVRIANDITHGTVSASPAVFAIKDLAGADRTVTLTATPDANYTIGSVSYNDGEDHTITPVNGVHAFTMPEKDVTVTAAFVPAEPVITGADLVLNGTLDFRFYVALPANFDAGDARMSFTVHGRSINVPFAQADTAEDGRKIFPCPVYSIEMAEPVAAVFHYTQDGQSKTVTRTSSIKEYLEALDKAEGKTQELVDLIAAVRNYGHYIQPYLARLHNFTIGEGGYAEMPAAGSITPLQALDDFQTRWHSKNTELLDSVGYYDSFNTSTILHVQIKLKTEKTVTATVDGANWTVRKLGGNVYAIEIPDIAANDLGKSWRVVFKAGETEICDMEVSALTYVSAVLASGRDQADEKAALTAFYNYYKAAEAFGSY